MILIVDDNKTRLLYLSDIIKNIDEDIITATNGKDGVRSAFENQPDLIMVDMIMPDIYGVDVIESVRQNRKTSDIPIIAFSSIVKKDRGIALIIEKGADDFLLLPRDDGLILEKVRLHLKGGNGG